MSDSYFDPSDPDDTLAPESAPGVSVVSSEPADVPDRSDAPDVSDGTPDAPDTPGTPEAERTLASADTDVEDRDAKLVDKTAKLEADAPPERDGQEALDKRDPEALERAREYLREHGRGLSRGGRSL